MLQGHRRADPLVEQHEPPPMSLDWDTLETPVRVFWRKMPPKRATVIDEQSGEVYDVR